MKPKTEKQKEKSNDKSKEKSNENHEQAKAITKVKSSAENQISDANKSEESG